MSANYRATTALYIIIARHKDTSTTFSTWAGKSACKVDIQGNKMYLYDERSLSLFLLNWTHGFDQILVWDCWNKRHINL